MPSARVGSFASAVDTIDSLGMGSPSGAVEFLPSDHQQRIFDWVRDGKGNLIVEAYAGTGKTETIVRAVRNAPEQAILLCAFAKKNQQALQARVTNPNARVMTLHALGYEGIRKGPWGYQRADFGVTRAKSLASAVCKKLPYGAVKLVTQLVSKVRELTPLNLSYGAVEAVAVEFDMLPSDEEKGLKDAQVIFATQEACLLAAKEVPYETGVDSADMIYLPLVHDWIKPTYGLIIVDEYQDMTASQLEIAQRALLPGGRMVLVGDRHQAIYGFRGAGGEEVAALKARLDAPEYALPLTYRCPQIIVRLAQELVPGYQVAETAPEGYIGQLRGLASLLETVQPDNYILSRSNAPLAEIAMALIREGRRVKVMGRDIGAGLRALVTRLNARSIPQLLLKLGHWEAREVVRLTAMKREDLIDAVQDKAQTLRVIARDMSEVKELLNRLFTLFDNDDHNEGHVICSTVHKAKGLEADHTFLLANTFRRSTPEKPVSHEEDNIRYVAITRAKKGLTWVENFPKPRPKGITE